MFKIPEEESSVMPYYTHSPSIDIPSGYYNQVGRKVSKLLQELCKLKADKIRAYIPAVLSLAL